MCLRQSIISVVWIEISQTLNNRVKSCFGHYVLLCESKNALLGFLLCGSHLARCTEFVQKLEKQTDFTTTKGGSSCSAAGFEEEDCGQRQLGGGIEVGEAVSNQLSKHVGIRRFC